MSDLTDNGIVVTTVEVGREWLDYNDHMNVAYYVMAFDFGIDAFKDVIGITLDYIEREKRSTVALESHISYLQEATLGDALRIETRIVDFDGKRVHYYQEMYRGETLLSTQETLSISFSTESRRSCEFEDQARERYQTMLERQGQLPRPEAIGKRIGIRRKQVAP